jgi:diacylglycerol kinase (ATP)
MSAVRFPFVRVTLLHHPRAGVEQHSAGALTALLAAAGHVVVAHASVKEPGWRAALDAHSELVVVAGGDGTVQAVFTELATSSTLVAVLPTGSANNVARTLGYRGEELADLVACWEHGTRRRYDVAAASGSNATQRFVEAIGGGIFADVLAHAEDVEADPDGEEKLALGLRLLRNVAGAARAERWELEADGVDLSGHYLAVEAMNIREAGPNVPLARDADPGDGRLDLVCVRPEDREALLAYVEASLRKRTADPLDLPVQQAARITMRPPVGCTVHVDDELWPEESSATRSTIVATASGTLELLIPGTSRGR